MDQERSLTAHYWFRAIVMAGFAFYILHLVKAGRLMYYIAPRMEVYVKCAAIALFVLALYQGFQGLRSFFGKPGELCDCEHEPPRSALRNVWMYGLFLVPLTLGFALPDKLMGSDIASMKGMNLSGGGAAGTVVRSASSAPTAPEVPVAAPPGSAITAGGSKEETEAADGEANQAKPTPAGELDRLFAPDDFNKPFLSLGKKLYANDRIVVKEEGFMEILTTVDLFLDRYVGKSMEITGFVYREPDMSDNQFVVSRLAMQCCAADSSPYGVLVESAMAKSFDKDSWVKLVGTIGKTTYRDNEIMKLDATRIQKVQAPETPYVYPYFDEFAKLAD